MGLSRSHIVARLAPVFFALRGAVFRGRLHHCSVCGSVLRAFAGPGGSFLRRDSGYCPRCNSKSRHRFLMYLVGRGLVPRPAAPALIVAPSYSESVVWKGVRSVVTDIRPGVGVDVVSDLQRLPFRRARFRGAVCVHVLEHVDDDSSAVSELSRVLEGGGVAIVGVPFDGRPETDEDPTVTDPGERRRRFGEPDHRRAYGLDLSDRLQLAGFDVTAFLSRDLDEQTREVEGIRPDEAVFVAAAPD